MWRSARNGRPTGFSTKAKRGERAGRRALRRTGGSEDVIDELRRQYDRLTQSQKRIAEYIVDHPDRVAFSTVDQMAGQLGVNPSTIVRFTYRLGLKGFPDLQERTRALGRRPLSAAREHANANSGLARPHPGREGRGLAARKRHHRSGPPGLRGRRVQRL